MQEASHRVLSCSACSRRALALVGVTIADCGVRVDVARVWRSDVQALGLGVRRNSNVLLVS